MDKTHNLLRTLQHRRQNRPGPQPAAYLSNLPPELVEMIADCLDRHDICSLRKVSRYMYQCSFRPFKPLLRLIYTDLSLESLTSLQQLAQDPSLAPAVQHLVIYKLRQEKYGHGFNWRRRNTGWSFADSRGYNSFRDILKGLVNCRSIKLFGEKFMRRSLKAGRSLSPLEVLGVLCSLVAMDGLQLKDLEIDVWIEGHFGAEAYGAVDAISSLIQSHPVLVAGFASVEALTLLKTWFNSPADEVTLVNMLRSAASLRKLEISFTQKRHSQGLMVALAAGGEHLQLQELELRNGCFRQATDAIIRFLDSQRLTLRKLGLHTLGLVDHDDAWLAVLRSLIGARESVLQEIELAYLWRRIQIAYPPPVNQVRPVPDPLLYPLIPNVTTYDSTGAEIPPNIEMMKARPSGRSYFFGHTSDKMPVALGKLVDWSNFRSLRRDD